MKTSRFDFKEWPLDLLLDYALKIHHRGIRKDGSRIVNLLCKVENENKAVGDVKVLFEQSLEDLENHLMKEENVLFPYLFELVEATENGQPVGEMHCGTIRNPIRVMMVEHEGETDRHEEIKRLTSGYAVPEGSSDDYRELMNGLKEFFENLKEHIYIENEIIFPESIELEDGAR